MGRPSSLWGCPGSGSPDSGWEPLQRRSCGSRRLPGPSIGYAASGHLQRRRSVFIGIPAIRHRSVPRDASGGLAGSTTPKPSTHPDAVQGHGVAGSDPGDRFAASRAKHLQIRLSATSCHAKAKPFFHKETAIHLTASLPSREKKFQKSVDEHPRYLNNSASRHGDNASQR